MTSRNLIAGASILKARIVAAARAVVPKCPECAKAKYSQCTACHTAYAKRFRKMFPERVAAATKRSNVKVKSQMIAAYGGKCVCCGETEPAFLTIDHVNRDRREHLQREGLSTAGVSLYRRLRAQGWPKDGLRLLCMNCNFATRFGDPCPHELRKQNAA